MVSEQFPAVARAVGVPAVRAPMSHDRAVVVMRLAFGPPHRSTDNLRHVQAVALSVVAAAAGRLQRTFFEEVAMPTVDLAEHGGVPNLGAAPARDAGVLVLNWQWDETSQRLKAIQKAKNRPGGRYDGERLAMSQTATQVMMQTGELTSCSLVGGEFQVVCKEPLLSKGLILECQTMEFILQGLLSRYPVDVQDAREVGRLMDGHRFAIMSFCMDRASANFSLLKWWWSQLTSPTMPPRVLPHAEPCNAHGIALVKNQPFGTKALVGKSHTFTTLLRGGRFNDIFGSRSRGWCPSGLSSGARSGQTAWRSRRRDSCGPSSGRRTQGTSTPRVAEASG